MAARSDRHLSRALALAGGIGLNYSIDLAGFGVLGIWVADLVWRGRAWSRWLED
jgi:hypothetical protein